MTVEQNDDPFGVFVFPESDREVSVAEDYYPGWENTTTVALTVERQQGQHTDVAVSRGLINNFFLNLVVHVVGLCQY